MLERNVYVIIRGPMGVGKSTTAAYLSKRLCERGMLSANISMDRLRKMVGTGEINDQNNRIATENAIILANSFLEKRYLPIIEGILGQRYLGMVTAGVAAGSLLFRLSCERHVCYERDGDRERPVGIERIDRMYDHYEATAHLHPEERIIDNGTESIDRVTDRILDEIERALHVEQLALAEEKPLKRTY